MQRCITVYSSERSFQKALEEVCWKIHQNGEKPLLIVFSSCNASFSFFSQGLHDFFPETLVVGTTSYLQFNTSGNGQFGISLMAVFSGIECNAGTLFEIDRSPSEYVENIRACLNHFSSYENMCCLEFMTAHSKGEELVLDTLNSVLKSNQIPVFGGTSGSCSPDTDDSTMISLNGTLYANTCVFILIKNLNGRIFTYKEHIYRPTKNTFRATDIACEDRQVFEYDGKPAALVIAEALKTDLATLPKKLEGQPVGRTVNKEIYITEAAKVNADNSITFYSQIYNYTKNCLMEMDDISTVFNKTKKIVHDNIDGNFMFVVNCLSRTKLFEQKKMLVPFLDNMRSLAPSFFGISGYGEQYNFIHINQTMILAVFE